MATASCPFFDRLPAELRLHVYEHVFSSADNNNSSLAINLFQTNPPQKDLLLTCRKIHHEARELYLSAYRSYWRASHFVALRSESEIPTVSELDGLRDVDLVHITSLKLVRRAVCEVLYDLHDCRGGWRCTQSAGTDYRQIVSFWSPYSHPLTVGVRGLSVYAEEAWMMEAIEREARSVADGSGAWVGMKEQVAMLLGIGDENEDDQEYSF